MIRLSVLCLVLLGSLQPALGAADPDAPPLTAPDTAGEPMAYHGVGWTDCAAFTRALAVERRSRPPGLTAAGLYFTGDYAAYLSWLDGYLTAKNELARFDRMVGNNSTVDFRVRWLELFCVANPHAKFFGAAYRLRDYLAERGM